MQKLFSNSWKVLGVLTGLSFLLRFYSFFPSVIDHDESTYILIADALRSGQVYLRDVMDTKPIGIFLLFALVQTLFGKTIIAIRIITTVWIAITGWVIFLTHRQFISGNVQNGFNPAPVASGLIYVFMTSLYKMYGMSPNTELFFNLFTITSLFLILRHRGLGWYFLAGLLLGLGFLIKYVVLFDAIALGFFYIWLQVTSGKTWSYWLVRCIMMGVAFLIPFMIVWIYYIRLNLGEVFWFYSFLLSSRYVIKPLWHVYVTFVLNGALSFLPVVIWYFYCVSHWRKPDLNLTLLGLWWGILDMIIILLPGKLFPHYFIQFMLPLSLVAGSFFDPRRSPGRALAWIRNPTLGFSIIVLLIGLDMVVHKIIFYDKNDYPRKVASYLNSKLEPGDVLYTGDYHHIIYLLTGTSSPTRYIHSSLIWLPENSQALDIDPVEEMDMILEKQPRFILIRYPLFEKNPLYKTLRTSYTMEKMFDREVMVYERK